MVTLQEIAEQVGVTPVTVSRVLSGSYVAKRQDAVSRAQLIQKVADDMGYRPNAAARSTRTGRFNTYGMVMSTDATRNYFPRDLLFGVEQALQDRGLGMLISTLSDEALTDASLVPGVISKLMVDGLLINYTHKYPDRMVRLIDQYAIPAVWINSRHEKNCVRPDDQLAGHAAAEQLLRLGHQRIAFVNHCSETHYSTVERRKGYEGAMKAAGLESLLSHTPGRSLLNAERREIARDMLSGKDRPTAVIAYQPHDALVVLFEAIRLGLEVPRDLSLITFSDRAETSSGLDLATWVIPEERVGREAVNMLARRIEEPGRDLPPVSIPLLIKEGDTLSPPSFLSHS